MLPRGAEHFRARRSRKCGEKLCDRTIVSGEDKIRTHIGQWLQDEAACSHARMRQDESGRVGDQFAGVKDVEVEQSRGVPAADGGASEFRLEMDEVPEQTIGVERGAYFHHGVEKGCRAGRTVDGLGLVDAGERGRRCAFVQREEQIPALNQMGQSIAEVGSEGDAGGALEVVGWHVMLSNHFRPGEAARTG